MGFAELSNVDRLRRLFEAFNEKHDILRLLDSCLRAEGIQSSSVKSRATGFWMISRRHGRPIRWTTGCGCSASSARPAWPTKRVIPIRGCDRKTAGFGP